MNRSIAIPNHSKQVIFHQLLAAARKIWLVDALRAAVSTIDPKELKKELAHYVPADVQKVLGTSGIRDEEVFPTPLLLEAKPSLVGYYRLLLGISQKQFYRTETGLAKFKRMEDSDILSSQARAAVPELCEAMSGALAQLVRQISPTLTSRDVNELPLLTLGSRFYGSDNNRIGQQAIQDVFLAIVEIVESHIVERGNRELKVRNAAGRIVTVSVSSDPDVRIEEGFDGKIRSKVAIEIKGGTDSSNAHNRAGEAEKSHLKARGQGFRDFWTIIATKGVDQERLRAGSPTTISWFNVAEVIGREGTDWNEFKSRIVDVVGIP